MDGDAQPICLSPDHSCDELTAAKTDAADWEHKRQQVAVESQWKFEDISAAKLPWAELHGESEDPKASVHRIVSYRRPPEADCTKMRQLVEACRPH